MQLETPRYNGALLYPAEQIRHLHSFHYSYRSNESCEGPKPKTRIESHQLVAAVAAAALIVDEEATDKIGKEFRLEREKAPSAEHGAARVIDRHRSRSSVARKLLCRRRGRPAVAVAAATTMTTTTTTTTTAMMISSTAQSSVSAGS